MSLIFGNVIFASFPVDGEMKKVRMKNGNWSRSSPDAVSLFALVMILRTEAFVIVECRGFLIIERFQVVFQKPKNGFE